MIDQNTLVPLPTSVDVRKRNGRLLRAALLLASCLAVLVSFYFVYKQPVPNMAILLWLGFFGGIAATIYRPRYGIYLTLMFSLIADSNLIIWWPFTTNFSSDWSPLFLNKSLVFNPQEVYIVVTFVSWLIRWLLERNYKIVTGRLFWPAVVFTLFIITGIAYGFRAGGDRVIGLSEARPLFYLGVMLFLTSNLIKTRQQVNVLIWLAMLGIIGPAIGGIEVFFFELKGDLQGIRSVALHATAIQMNTMIVLIFASWLYKASKAKRVLLPVLALPVLFTYFITQRRAAFVSLFVAFFLLAILLFLQNRRLFLKIVPPLALVAVAYIGVFWNNSSLLGEPAKAVKSVIAPNQLDQVDQTSNYYRIIENANLIFTMRNKPVFGVGFGMPFYVIYPMPDISFFTNWQFFSHNSIIWVWLKMGAAGFFTMLFLVGSAIMTGTETFRKFGPEDRDMKAIFLMLTLYLVMHFLYAYVDISWDNRSMVYVGVTMGLINYFQQAVLPEIKTASQALPAWVQGSAALRSAALASQAKQEVVE